MAWGRRQLALLSFAVALGGGCGNVAVSPDGGRDSMVSGGGGSGGGPGTGGTAGGAGGSVGTGGSAAGTGGSTAGTGGSAAGTGGSAAGTGGSAAGTGGSAAGTGGSATGTGGSAGTGGSVGTGGSTGTGGTAGSGARPECTADADCRIFADCCTCVGLAPGEMDPASCPAICMQDKCAQLGITTKRPACVAGRCVAGFQCDGKVTCRAAEPVCPAGSVATANGICWGECVPTTECSSVVSCAKCGTTAQACASMVAQLGPQHHCVTIPAACGGAASCACMGPTVCRPPFSSCADYSGIRGVMCSCPNC